VAALRGDGDAALELGTMYMRGDKVTANPAVAVRWLKVGTEAANLRAMYYLFVLCADGHDKLLL